MTAWGALAATLTGLAAAYAAVSSPDRRLERLRVEADILKTLDSGIAKCNMQKLVDAHSQELADRLHVRRYWFGIVAGGLVYTVAASFGLAGVRTGEFWPSVLAVPSFGLAGIALYAAFRSWSRVPRDREGFRLKPGGDG